MSDGNGNGTGGTVGDGRMLVAAPVRTRRALAVIDVPDDSPKLLMNCRACSKGGGDLVDWSSNGRRCPAWMDDPHGRCVYELRAISVPFDRNEIVTYESWLSDMRHWFNVIGREIMLELQINRALGIESKPSLMRAGISMIARMHDVFKHADKMDLFRRALKDSGGDTAAAGMRFLLSLALDQDVREQVLSDMSAGDGALKEMLNKVVDALAVRHPERSEEEETRLIPEEPDADFDEGQATRKGDR